LYQDTIAAISTPLGQGGIGIVRLSGPRALDIVRALLPPEGGTRLCHRRLTYSQVVDPASGHLVDEVLVCFMAAPHTYTREDVVEINCHGGPLPLQRILELALRQGARLAQPGEFTLRAFLNGRIDLAQAEAVLDVVQAKTEASLRLALGGLEGRLSQQVRALRGQVLEMLAYLTARVDFPEDDVEEQDLSGPLTAACRQAEALLRDADAGIVFRQGVRTAIVGRPNVGKSSLLNLLLRQSRAIVTPVPGTTRDTLEEVANLKGVPFVLVDTAGIVDSQDQVERQGVDRSRRALAEADLVLLVLDGSQPLQREDWEVMALLGNKTVLAVVNKMDLPLAADTSSLPWPQEQLCALNGQGLEELEQAMVRLVLGGQAAPSDSLLVSNPRHKEALGRALDHLQAAAQGLQQGTPQDLLAVDLTGAATALGEITGETVGQDLLEVIFSRFCIGK
jgi:tRNA modification GTPase